MGINAYAALTDSVYAIIKPTMSVAVGTDGELYYRQQYGVSEKVNEEPVSSEDLLAAGLNVTAGDWYRASGSDIWAVFTTMYSPNYCMSIQNASWSTSKEFEVAGWVRADAEPLESGPILKYGADGKHSVVGAYGDTDYTNRLNEIYTSSCGNLVIAGQTNWVSKEGCNYEAQVSVDEIKQLIELKYQPGQVVTIAVASGIKFNSATGGIDWETVGIEDTDGYGLGLGGVYSIANTYGFGSGCLHYDSNKDNICDDCYAALGSTGSSVDIGDESGGTFGEALTWYLDGDGILYIDGYGEAPVFNSPEDQPWASVRDQIKEVWYLSMGDIYVPNMQYWFTGCSNLEKAEIPYTCEVIGTDAFAHCNSLEEIYLYYYDSDVFEIVEGAFRTDEFVLTKVYLDDTQREVYAYAIDYYVNCDNRFALYFDVYALNFLDTYRCPDCNVDVSGKVYFTAPWWGIDPEQHQGKMNCPHCGMNVYMDYYLEDHTFSGNSCTKCGYTKSSGSSGGGNNSGGGGGGYTPSVCYHYYTYYEYEDYDDATYHYKNEICDDCGVEVDWDYDMHEYSSDTDISCNKCYYRRTIQVTKYTITYENVVGTISRTDSVNVTAGTSVTLPTPSPSSYRGHTFDGWYTSDSGGVKKGDAGGSFTPTSDIVLYARWNEIPGEIKVVPNGGVVKGIDGVGHSEAFIYMGIHHGPEVDIYIPFTTPKYTLSFNSNGGSDVSSISATSKFNSWTKNSGFAGTLSSTTSSGTYRFSGKDVKDSITASYSASVKISSVPVRSGYTFDGWYKSANFTGIKYNIGDTLTLTENTTLYAKWTQVSKPTYTLTYRACGGQVTPAFKTVDVGSSVILPLPTRNGYKFSGWYDSQFGGNFIGINGDEYTPGGNISIYAQWVKTSSSSSIYEVRYNGNGSTDGSMNNSVHTANVSKALSANQFTKSYTITLDHNYIGGSTQYMQYDYTFAGWGTSSTGSVVYSDGQSVLNLVSSGVFDLYAIWSGNAVGLPNLTRSGYTFKGWYTASSGGAKVASSYKPTADVTIYAQWTALDQITDYLVSFDANGGTVTPSGYGVNKGSELPLPTPTKTTQPNLFLGWYTAKVGGEWIGGSGDKFTPDGNITLYAHWGNPTTKYTVTYNAYGGECIASEQVTANTAVTLATPTMDGYNFLGWYTNEHGGELVGKAGESYTVRGNITLHAHWEKIPTYTVSYNVGDRADYIPSSVVNRGDSLELPGVSASGFLGWYTLSVNGTKVGGEGDLYTPKQNITLYAHWDSSGEAPEEGEVGDGQVKIIYDALQGEFSDGTKQVISVGDIGSVIDSVPTPAWTGYIFRGWITPFGEVLEAGKSLYPSETMTVTPLWGCGCPGTIGNPDRTSSITFNASPGKFYDGTEEKIVTGNRGERILHPSSPTLEGYRFMGWVMPHGKLLSLTEVFPSLNHTVTAVWVKTDDTEDGSVIVSWSVDGVIIDTYTGITGEPMYAPDAPERDGRSFLGWGYYDEGVWVDVPDTFPEVSITYEARYSGINKHTITWVVETGNTITTTQVFGSQINPPSDPTKDGYNFLGWYTEDNGTGDKLVDPYPGVTEDTTYYAHWGERAIDSGTAADGYINFYVNGALYARVAQTIGTAINFPEDPVVTGYKHSGWSKTARDPWILFGPSVFKETTWKYSKGTELTLHSSLQRKLSIILGFAGGRLHFIELAFYGDTIDKFCDCPPTKSGYTWDGWYDDNGSGEKISFPFKWTKDFTTYSIYGHFISNGGTTDPVPPDDPIGGEDWEGKIIFYVDDEIHSIIDQITGDSIIFPNISTEVGYTYCWIDYDTGSRYPLSEMGIETYIWDEPSGTIKVLYLEKAANEYTVHFYYNADNLDKYRVYDVRTMWYGEACGTDWLVAEPSRTGYTLVGWFTGQKGTGQKITESTVWTYTDIDKLYSHFTPKTYTTRFIVDSSAQKAPDGTFIWVQTYDSKLNAPTVSKDGYNFLYWYDIQGNIYYPDSTWNLDAISEVSLYAQWESTGPTTSTLQVDPNGGIWNSTTDITAITREPGDTYTLVDPVGPSFTITLDPQGGTCSTTSVTGNQTFEGWDVSSLNGVGILNEKTFTFESTSAGKSGSIKATYTHGYVTLPTPTRAGYEFKGWYSAPEGGNRYNTTCAFMYNHTLYAQWTRVTYTVDYNINYTGGTNPNSVTVNAGDSTTLPSPTRSGYTLTGWYTSASGGTKVGNGGDSYTPSGSIPLYAQWAVTEGYYVITYVVEGVTDGYPYSEIVKAGESIILPIPEEPHGYYLYGWYEDYLGETRYKPGSEYTPTGNVTLHCFAAVDDRTFSVDPNGGYWDNGILSGTSLMTFNSIDHGPTIDVPLPSSTPTYTASFDTAGGSAVSAISKQSRFVRWGTDFLFDGTLSSTTRAGTYEFTPEWNLLWFNLKITAYYRSTITMPSAPTLQGKRFMGWYLESDPDVLYNPGQNVGISGDTTFYAKWGDITDFTLTLNHSPGNLNGNSSSSYTVTIDSANNSNLYSYIPSYEGHTFNGWYTASTSGVKVYGADGKCVNDGTYWVDGKWKYSGNITLYAQWTRVTYTVDYNINYTGGTNPSSVTVNAGDSITLPSPTRSGYTLAGWYTSASGGTKVGNAGDSYTPSGSIPLYAQWTKVTYTVAYNINYTGGTNPSSVTVNAGASTTLPNPTRSGYTLAGWYTSASGGDRVGNGGDSYIPSGNTTLYAQWTKVTYTVAYNINYTGGTNPSSVTVNAGDSTTLPNPTRSGYTFNGWYTSASGGDRVGNAGDSYAPSGNTTLYAQWTRVTYTVEYSISYTGGTNPSSVTVNAGDSTTLPNPTRSGYTLNGWYTSASGGTKVGNAGASYTPSGNTTLYAQWTANRYTVTYDGNGATEGSTASSIHTVDSNTSLTENGYARKYSVTLNVNGGNALATSTLWSNYSFVGWSTAVDGSGTRYNDKQSVSNLSMANGSTVTLYAIWDKNTGSVTLPTATRSGYTFDGWYTSASGGDQVGVAGASYTPSGNITLYAKWTNIPKSTLQVDPNGGVWEGSSGIQTFTGAKDDTKVINDPAIRTGYTFSDWDIGRWNDATQDWDATGPYGAGFNTANNTFTFGNPHEIYGLTAIWLANKYTVNYHANGGTGSMSSSSHTYDVAQSLKANTYTRSYTVTYNYNGSSAGSTNATANYTFDGWAKTSNGAVVYSDKESVVNLSSEFNGTINLYAKWVSGSVTLPTAERTGYKFEGWYTAPTNGTKVGNAGTSYTPTENTTLYARWTANIVTIALDAQGGSVNPGSVDFTVGEVISSLPRPERTGYEFNGWYSQPNGGGTKYDTGSIVPTDSITLYAKWTANTGVIEFYVGGELYDTITQTVDSNIVFPTNPTLEYHNFSYWTATSCNYKTDTTASTAPSKYTDTVWNGAGTTLKLYAYGTPYKAKLYIDIAGTIETYSGTYVYYGDTYNSFRAQNPTYTGYTFYKWAIKYSNGSIRYIDFPFKWDVPIVDNGECTLLAIFDSVTYTSTWKDSDLSSTFATISQKFHNLTVFPDTNPTKPGYVFDKWVLEDGSDVPEYWNIEENVVIVPQFKGSGDVVYFYYDEYDKPNPRYLGPITQTAGQVVTLPGTDPRLYAKQFLGWYTSATGGTQVKAGDTWVYSGTTKLYAHWADADDPVAGYTIKYYLQNTALNGYDLDKTETTTGTVGDVVTAPSRSYSGFTLNNSKSTLSGTVVANGSLVLSVYYDRASGTTFTWDAGTNGGTIPGKGASTTTQQTFGTAFVLPTEPTKTGSKFMGWYTGTGEQITSSTINYYTSSKTFYAKFSDSEIVTSDLTLELSGGKVNNSSNAIQYEDKSPGTVINLPIPTISQFKVTFDSKGGSSVSAINTNRVFNGWVISSKEFNAGTLDNNNNTFTFSGVVNGRGTLSATYTDGQIQLPGSTKSNYTLEGWYADSTCSGTRVGRAGDTVTISKDTKLYANWVKVTPGSVTITWNTNGSTVQTSGAPNSTITKPADPVLVGDRFLGWSTSSSTWVDIPSVFPESNATYYAHFVKKYAHVDFFIDGVKVNTDPLVINYGDKLVSGVVFNQTGYTLSNWYTTDESTGKAYVDGTTTWDIVTADNAPDVPHVNLYAHRVPNYATTKVTFYVDGVSKGSKTQTWGEERQFIEDPTKHNQQFVGWKVRGSADDFVESTGIWERPVQNLTLDAVFEDCDGYINFYVNDVLYDTLGQTNGNVVVLPSSVTVPAGYKHMYWTADIYTNWMAEDKNVPEQFTTAIWDLPRGTEINLYSYLRNTSFKLKGNVDGSVSTLITTHYYDETVDTFKSASPTKTGYTFTGWYDDSGSGNKFEFPNTWDIVVADGGEYTVYAHFEANKYHLTFYVDGEILKTLDDKTEWVQTYDSNRVFPANPVKAGYVFTGWNTKEDGSGENYSTTGGWGYTYSGPLYAQFKTETRVTITWLVNGKVHAITSGVPGETVVKPSNPSVTGYTFKDSAWLDKNNNVVTFPMVYPTSSVELHANMVPNTYSVNFYSNGTTKFTGPLTQTTDAVVALPSTLPTNGDKTFAGWYTSATGGEEVREGELWKFTDITKLYAHWDDRSWDTSYDLEVRTSNVGMYQFYITAREEPYQNHLPISVVGHEYFPLSTLTLTTEVNNKIPSATYSKSNVVKVDIVFAVGEYGQASTLLNNQTSFLNALNSNVNIDAKIVKTINTVISKVDMNEVNPWIVFSDWEQYPVKNSFQLTSDGKYLINHGGQGDEFVITLDGVKYYGDDTAGYNQCYLDPDSVNTLDLDLSAWINPHPGVGCGSGFVFRWDKATDSCYLLAVGGESRNHIALYKMSNISKYWGGDFDKTISNMLKQNINHNGSTGTLLAYGSSKGGTGTYRVTMDNAGKIVVYKNGTSVLTYTDSSPISSGYCGLFASCTVAIKDVKFQYTQIEKKTLGEVMQETEWRDNSVRFIIHATDEIPVECEVGNEDLFDYTVTKIMGSNAYLINLGRTSNKSALDKLMNGIVKADGEAKGVYYANTNVTTALNNASTYIKDKVALNETTGDWMLVDSEILWYTYWDDPELDVAWNFGEHNGTRKQPQDMSDTTLASTWTSSWGILLTYNTPDQKIDSEKWRYKHNQYYFDTPNGLVSNNSIWIPDPIEVFDRVGKYRINYKRKDNPLYEDVSKTSLFEEYRKWSNDYGNGS